MTRSIWRLAKLCAFMLAAAYCSSLATAQQQPEPPPAAPTPAVEFREIHPDARKLIVDEIRLQLQTESEQQFARFTNQIESWLQIGSGVVAVLGAILALVGWRGLSNLRQTIKNDVTSFVRTDQLFQAELDKKLTMISETSTAKANDKTRREINLARLDMLSDKVSKAPSYSALERKAMIELLLSVKDDTDLLKTDAFEKTVQTVVESLYNADVDFAIDELEDQLGDYFGGSSPLCNLLIRHYGERVLTDADTDEKSVARFRKYVAACKARNLFELAAPFLLALTFRDKANGWSGAIDATLKQLRYLTDDEKAFVLDRFIAASKAPPEATITFRQAREVELLAAFFAEYGDKLTKACEPKA